MLMQSAHKPVPSIYTYPLMNREQAFLIMACFSFPNYLCSWMSHLLISKHIPHTDLQPLLWIQRDVYIHVRFKPYIYIVRAFDAYTYKYRDTYTYYIYIFSNWLEAYLLQQRYLSLRMLFTLIIEIIWPIAVLFQTVFYHVSMLLWLLPCSTWEGTICLCVCCEFRGDDIFMIGCEFRLNHGACVGALLVYLSWCRMSCILSRRVHEGGWQQMGEMCGICL